MTGFTHTVPMQNLAIVKELQWIVFQKELETTSSVLAVSAGDYDAHAPNKSDTYRGRGEAKGDGRSGARCLYLTRRGWSCCGACSCETSRRTTDPTLGPAPCKAQMHS